MQSTMNYNQGRGGFGGQQGSFGPLGFVVKGMAAGIGLASESIHHHKEEKAAKKLALSRGNSGESGTLSPPSNGDLSRKTTSSSTHSSAHEKEPHVHGEHEEGDEEQWDLDDAQDDLIAEHHKPKDRPFERDPKKMIKHFTDDYSTPQGIELKRLTLPVVLPQRRPRDRSRGFVRAYTPELNNVGIDQPTFVDFLDTFNQATLASPWLNAINLAGFAFMALPTGVSQAATIALALTVHVAKHMQSRHRYNSVLDQINDDFYRPRGCYAMILTWEPESDQMQIGINLNEMIGKNLTPPEGIIQKTKHSLRPSMGKTNGVAFPQTAPLIFPALDHLQDSQSQEAKTTKEKMLRAKNFAGDYFDRRAQAKYAAENPDSQLLVAPKPTFTSRYSDPNNPSNSGDLLALITGGKLSRGGFGGGMGGRGMGMGGGPLGMAMSYGGGRGMGGYGGRGSMGNNQQYFHQYSNQQYYEQQYVNQEYSTQQYSAQQYSTQRYPNQQYSSQMYSNQMMGPGFGGPMMIQNGIKRILRHNVLYLLIVNMPTDQEMADALKFMDKAEADYAQQQAA